MSAEQLIEQGDFRGALELLRQTTSGPQAAPAELLTRFGMEVRLQAFDAAEDTMARLCAAAPDVAPVMSQFGLAARAERHAIKRLSDAALAMKRATVGLPPPHMLVLVKAAVGHAQGDAAGAKAALAEASANTPATAGTVSRKNGASLRFTNIKDTDDLTGASLPCYEGETLLDLAYSEIQSITFGEPKTSYDVMWPRAEVLLCTGEVLHVRVPALYPGGGTSEDDFVRTGRMTTWTHDKGYAEGHGQRDLRLTTPEGDSVMGILSIASITFDNPKRIARSPVARAPMMTQGPANWSTTHRAVAWTAGILAAMLFFRPSLLFALAEDIRYPAIVIGLLVCALVGWVASQVSTKGMAAAAVVITFVVTTLRWIL